MTVTVGGTLGAPSNVEMCAVACDDGVLEVPEATAEKALSEGRCYKRTVATVGTGGGPLPWVYSFNGTRAVFAQLYGIDWPPAVVPPVVVPTPVVGTIPTPPPTPAPASNADCPYMGKILAFDGKVLAAMINDVGKAIGTKWSKW